MRPKAVSQYLLEKMRQAEVKKAYFILCEGKRDIPQCFGGEAAFDLDLGYLMMWLPFGLPYALDQAYSFVSGRGVRIPRHLVWRGRCVCSIA